MKNKNLLLCGSALLAALVGCDDGGGGGDVDGGITCATPEFSQSENITADTTWCTGQTVTLQSRIYETNGATLTIQPGVIVKGAPGAESALVVSRNGHLDAQGTATQPIVMTSGKPEGARLPGDWGGIVMFGRAPVNAGANVVFEGLNADELNTYGGTDDAWNCGTIKYVRVEFAGQIFAPDKEFNGITAAGCGSATSISYVQLHRGNDDGIEFFGGSANFDHVLVTQQDDDGLDWDFGWHGRGQYLIVHNTVGDQGMEADNNALGTITDAPRSEPTLYNMTFLGAGAAVTGKGQGIMLRRATLGLVRNSIFQDMTGKFDIRPTTMPRELVATYETFWPGRLAVENSYFVNVVIPTTSSTSDADCTKVDSSCVDPAPPAPICARNTSEKQSFPTAAHLNEALRYNNTTNAAVNNMPLVTVGAGAIPNFCPAASTAPVANGGSAPTGIDAAGLTYAGACAPGTAAASAWYAGWSSFPAN